MFICIKWIWHKITHKGWYAIKPKQTNKQTNKQTPPLPLSPPSLLSIMITRTIMTTIPFPQYCQPYMPLVWQWRWTCGFLSKLPFSSILIRGVLKRVTWLASSNGRKPKTSHFRNPNKMKRWRLLAVIDCDAVV